MANQLYGYQPSDLCAAIGSENPQCAIFTTYTFSPGTFQQQYLTPLVACGCGDIVVLTDSFGYAQSLFAAAAVQGVGTDYRLRQVSASGAFHGKLVLVRTASAMLVGVGSGNLTTAGLLTNAEVGALYRVNATESLRELDLLMSRLRGMGEREHPTTFDRVRPIELATNTRLLTSLDESLIEQIDLPEEVQRVEIFSPFVDGQLQALETIRGLWPRAKVSLRIDPNFGALTDLLLANQSQGIEVLVPVETSEKDQDPRPAVHGKLICFIGKDTTTIILGSANLSEPALLSTRNFEVVIEKKLPTASISNLLKLKRQHASTGAFFGEKGPFRHCCVSDRTPS